MTQKPESWKRWLVLSSIAVEMGVIIYAGNKVGQWLDQQYFPGEKTMATALTLVGVGIAMFLVVQQTKRLNP
ncbi:MAG: AtpZ/AtpI family protein [Flavobacteriaceae bacterium]|jgi:hypothetical protein|nr:AtpZ/AtpI family protein [Flavobacteriaceae bacterium]MDG1063557.1 AtpZ/AtpI family protein [Flavobacteriaceae bacterium]MDG1962629.1 AtpZ/AtpI family protein [Flavobacteriaceae bacterium]